MRTIRNIIKGAALFLSAAFLFGCSAGRKEYNDMNVTFLKVGKADAIIIQTAEHTVLIDSANSGEGKDIYQYCTESGRDKLDCFILTHFDQDHVGGAKAVISKFSSIDTIIEADYEETSDEYLKYRQSCEKKGYEPLRLSEPVQFTFDEAVFTVYPPEQESYKQCNDYSLVVTVEYGKKAFIFTGDAENKRISEIIEQIPERKKGYDLVKMPHHGQYEKKTDELVEFLKPEYAVICCSKKEPADQKVTDILNSANSEIFYTYDGTINFKCNGYEIVPDTAGTSEQ